MCKICIIPGITDKTTELVWKFITKMSKEMSGYSETDGFGYAAFDGQGNLFGERWLNPKEAFSNRDEKNILVQELIHKYKGFLRGKLPIYNKFGEGNMNSLRTAILHARNATTEKGLINVHPFVHGDSALIHNGIIANHEQLHKKYSTCDSEVILTEYNKFNVTNNIKNINNVASKLDGYYACSVLSKTDDNKYIVDVFKEDSARLKGYFIKEFNTVVFATPGANDTYGPIQSVCRDLNLTIVDEFDLEDSSLLRMDAMTGEVLDMCKFNSKFKKGKREVTVIDKWTQEFGNHNRGGGSQRSFSEKQKDEELERQLLENLSFMNYEDDTKEFTVLNQETKFNEAGDWEQSENGVWRKKTAAQ
jgi:predicted glutamine amidotransferase